MVMLVNTSSVCSVAVSFVLLKLMQYWKSTLVVIFIH